MAGKVGGWLAAMVALLALALAAPAAAQFPGSAPITIVMPYPPGGLGDYFVRLVAPKLAEQLGTTVLVDNKAGANPHEYAGRRRARAHRQCRAPGRDDWRVRFRPARAEAHRLRRA